MKMMAIFLRLAVICGLFLGGCGAYGAESLTLGVRELPRQLHPLIRSAETNMFLPHLWFTPLVEHREQSGWQCGVCTDLPSFENKMAALVPQGKYQLLKTIWKLNKDARWADGTPVTANDFVLSWDIIQTLKTEDSSAWPELSEIYKVEVGGNPRELVIWFGGKTSDFTKLLWFFPVPHHIEAAVWEASEKLTRAYFAQSHLNFSSLKSGLFNGPFYLSVAEADRFRLSVNPHRVPKPGLDRINIVKLDSYGKLAWSVRNNVVHLIPAGELTFPELIDLQKQLRTRDIKKPYQFRYAESRHSELIALNLRNPLLADVRLRQALSYGLNRRQVVEEVFTRTKVFDDNWAKALLGLVDQDGWQFDFSRTKAHQILDGLGWKLPPSSSASKFRVREERTLTIEVTYNESSDVRAREAEQLKQQWQALGIKVNLNAVSDDYFHKMVIAKAGFQDVALVSIDQPPSFSLLDIFHSKSIPSFDNNYAGQNIMGWHDNDADGSIESWGNAFLDKELRTNALQKLSERIQKEVPIIPLYRISDGTVFDARLSGVQVGSFWGPASQDAAAWQWSNTTAVKP